MRSIRTAFAIGLISLLLLACDGQIPRVRGLGAVVPNLSPPTEVSARHIPADDTKSLEEGEDDLDSCTEWVTERDSYNRWSGQYEQVYRCVEGGDIETIHVLGTRLDASSGHYRRIYTLRTGERIIWNYEYFPDPDDPEMMIYSGSSNLGEQFDAAYRELDHGATFAREVWILEEGRYEVEGVFEADNRFNGTVAFDDPDTEVSPDWHLVNIEEADGSLMQLLSGTLDGWRIEESLLIDADGAVVYDYTNDDLLTAAAPDYEGGYRFTASGDGSGGYLQHLDDGSRVEVTQQIMGSGAYDETWRFRDALTERPIDQEGELSYDEAGNGVGTITTYVVGGYAETCDLTISAEGSTVIDNCS